MVTLPSRIRKPKCGIPFHRPSALLVSTWHTACHRTYHQPCGTAHGPVPPSGPLPDGSYGTPLMTGASWRRGSSFPAKDSFLTLSRQLSCTERFQAQRGAAPDNGIFSSLSTISDLDFSASGCTHPTGLWLPSCRETAPHVCPWTALWARSPSGPWGEVPAEGTLTVKIFLPTCVSVWAQPQPFQNPQTCWCFQRTQTPGRL